MRMSFLATVFGFVASQSAYADGCDFIADAVANTNNQSRVVMKQTATSQAGIQTTREWRIIGTHQYSNEGKGWVSNNRPANWTGQGPIEQCNRAGLETVEGTETQVWTYRRVRPPDPAIARIWIDPGALLILRTEIDFQPRSKYRRTVSTFKYGAAVISPD